MNRRQFLIASLVGAASAEILYRSSWAQPGMRNFEFVTAYGHWVPTHILKLDPPLNSQVVIFDTKNFAMRSFAVPFRVHMSVQNPTRPEQLLFVSKWGNQLCSFDRHLGRVTKIQESGPHRRFFGHMVWDDLAGGFWVTEQDDVNVRGRLVLRDSNLKTMHEISSHGIFPHEMQMNKPGEITIANAGDFFGAYSADDNVPLAMRTSNLSRIDARTGNLIDQVKFPAWMNTAGASHFLVVPESGETFVGTMAKDQAQRTSIMRVAKSGACEAILPDNDDLPLFCGEIVSFTYIKDLQRVFWTHSKAPGVFSCSTTSPGPAELIVAAPAHGITSFDNEVLIAHANEPKLLTWSEGKMLKPTLGPMPAAEWGSHFSKIQTI